MAGVNTFQNSFKLMVVVNAIYNSKKYSFVYTKWCWFIVFIFLFKNKPSLHETSVENATCCVPQHVITSPFEGRSNELSNGATFHKV